MRKLIIICYLLIIVFLSVYSYSQIDLNLTLSSLVIYQNFQNQLIRLGYFNRYLSTAIYILILSFLFICYLFLLDLVKKKELTKKQIFTIVLATGLILIFAYPAFSHDFFNYMFDARIFTKYGLNPYSFKALDFPDDLWTRFMHWTHRTYPYGPIWLIISLPFSFLGFQKFTLTLFLFKILFLFAYFTNSFLIYKIVDDRNPSYSLHALSFFTFNPLIIIESLVSPHNDSLMLLFALLAIYLFLKKKYLKSFFSMLLSVGVKFITLSFLLIPFINLFFKKKLLVLPPFIYLISVIPVIYFRELLPWYAIPFIGFSALIAEYKLVRIFSLVISFVLPLKYVSFLISGQWTEFAYNLFLKLVIIAVLIPIVVYLVIPKLEKLTS